MEFSIEAYARIEPRIGPMQGVHPNPNPIPTINGNNRLLENFIL
jgi:hypothetical protein